jgi:hypothetical protein
MLGSLFLHDADERGFASYRFCHADSHGSGGQKSTNLIWQLRLTFIDPFGEGMHLGD